MTGQARPRLVFAGTPGFAAQALQCLIQQEVGELIGVYTQPDRPQGRGKKLSPSPVKSLALDAGIPVFQPPSLKASSEHEQLRALRADVMIVAAYGLLLPAELLAVPRYGCLNIHASLLPRWRGAAPIERAIEHGDRETGITIMRMDEGLDTGDMLLKKSCPITADTSGDTLHEQLALIGGEAIVTVLTSLQDYLASAEPQQDGQSCYAAKVNKSECQVDWSLDASVIERKLRAFYSRYTCHSFLGETRVKLGPGRSSQKAGSAPPGTIVALDKQGPHVATGNACVQLCNAQLPGGRMLPMSDLINARPELFAPGQRFSCA